VPLGKDAKALDVAEFPPEEMAAVLGEFDPKDSRRWRAWVVSTIAATQGARVNAILRLADADCDVADRTITWVAVHDKLGRRRVQPLTRDAVWAIRVARVWRRRMGYDGRWLVPAVRKTRRDADLPWVYSAYHRLLMEAEKGAGVPHRMYRGAHGIRRMVGRNALEASGDLNLAAEWIGDTDLRTFKKSYLKERGAALQGIAGKLSAHTASIQHFDPKADR
jgi:integrase